jgi:hypothetical protein
LFAQGQCLEWEWGLEEEEEEEEGGCREPTTCPGTERGWELTLLA